MIDTNNYIENISNTLSAVLFYTFGTTVAIITLILITTLIFLIIGCLIKSQKVKSKFLKVSISVLAMLVFMLAIPYIVVVFKSFI